MTPIMRAKGFLATHLVAIVFVTTMVGASLTGFLLFSTFQANCESTNEGRQAVRILLEYAVETTEQSPDLTPAERDGLIRFYREALRRIPLRDC